MRNVDLGRVSVRFTAAHPVFSAGEPGQVTAYTVGMTGLGAPELLVRGIIRPDMAAVMMREVARLLVAGHAFAGGLVPVARTGPGGPEGPDGGDAGGHLLLQLVPIGGPLLTLLSAAHEAYPGQVRAVELVPHPMN